MNLTFREISRSKSDNPHRFWMKQNAEGNKHDIPGSAWGRFESKDFVPVFNRPKFAFSKTEAVYTIGSCFARSVERALLTLNIDVPTTRVEVPAHLYSRESPYDNSVLNKYNPLSMALEILRGLGRKTLPNDGLLQQPNGKYFDPQTSVMGELEEGDARTVRRIMDECASGIRNCSVFLLTLGLTETWFLPKLELPFNNMNPAHVKPFKDEITFKNLTVTDCYDALAEAFVALKEEVPNARVVVTVSPIPLNRTFGPQDIIAANAYSKAVLRIVAQMLTDNFDFVDYFPSYEMVINSPRHMTWTADHKHVTSPVVERVITLFVERYFHETVSAGFAESL